MSIELSMLIIQSKIGLIKGYLLMFTMIGLLSIGVISAYDIYHSRSI